MFYINHYNSPLGSITLASDGGAVTGLWFDGQRHFGSTLGSDCRECDLPIFAETRRWLDVYFEGHDPGLLPPLRLIGTPFQISVWHQLLNIPYGQTFTYGQIAQVLAHTTGRPLSSRAVGNAVGRNPISLLIPCHRVVGADGSLTGYAGGIERKRILLRLEQSIGGK